LEVKPLYCAELVEVVIERPEAVNTGTPISDEAFQRPAFIDVS
jgi:hypothetical protein